MIEFVSSLKEEVQATLLSIETEERCVLRRSERSIEELEQAFVRLKSFTVSYTFESKEEEIEFFKQMKPTLFSTLIFYRKLYNIEINRPKGGQDEQRDYIKRHLCRLHDYFDCNRDFYKYYRSENTHMDEYYFLRQKPTIQLTMESFYFERDPHFSTAADFKMAKVIANDRVERYLMEELEKLDNKTLNSSRSGMVWTASKSDLVEQLYSNYLLQSINGGKITLKEMQKRAEEYFNIDLGNISRTLYDMSIRKNPTLFLDKMQKALSDYLKTLNE